MLVLSLFAVGFLSYILPSSSEKLSSFKVDGSGSVSDLSANHPAILAPGSILTFPNSSWISTFTPVYHESAFIVVDNNYYVEEEQSRLKSFFVEPKKYPSAFLVKYTGEFIRFFLFPDRPCLPYGAAASRDERTGFTFYQGPNVEIWAKGYQSKSTIHDVSVKPSYPIFDNRGNMWVPYHINDRQSEEGPRVITLWAYTPRGERWEVFVRSQTRIHNVHAVHIDRAGRIYLVGPERWLWEDGPYGRVLSDDVVLSEAHNKIDVLDFTTDVTNKEYQKEQRGRFCERNPHMCDNGKPLNDGWRSERLTGALKVVRHYDFPMRFTDCMYPVFALTGDGAVICSCLGDNVIIIAEIGNENADHGIIAENTFRISESHAPPLTEAGLRLVPNGKLKILHVLRSPYDLHDVGGVHMDQSGKAFYILDRVNGSSKILSLPWPLPVDDEGSVVLPKPRIVPVVRLPSRELDALAKARK